MVEIAKRHLAPSPAVIIQVLPARTRLFSIAAILMLAGCVTGLADDRVRRELMQPWLEVTGAQKSMSSGAFGTDYVVLQRPAAISVRGNDLYIVDAGLRAIFRYDRMQQTLTPFAVNLPVEAGMSIYAARDQSVYITSPSSGKVLHFSWNGMLLPSLASPGNLARPTSVTLDEYSGNVLVADGLRNHLVVFSSAGGVISIIKPRQVQSISAIATGPDGIYAIDSLARRVVVLARDGSFRYDIAGDSTSEPASIAVSRDNLVFVGDGFDNTVSAFRVHGPGKVTLAGKIGGTTGASDNFNGIGGLAVEDDMLFVADSLNARIQSLMINPDSTDAGRFK